MGREEEDDLVNMLKMKGYVSPKAKLEKILNNLYSAVIIHKQHNSTNHNRELEDTTTDEAEQQRDIDIDIENMRQVGKITNELNEFIKSEFKNYNTYDIVKIIRNMPSVDKDYINKKITHISDCIISDKDIPDVRRNKGYSSLVSRRDSGSHSKLKERSRTPSPLPRYRGGRKTNRRKRTYRRKRTNRRHRKTRN
jgi:hypothetical protein